MAIVKCPECGEKVSNQAELCPHCGITISELGLLPQEENEEAYATESKQPLIKLNKKALIIISVAFLFVVVLISSFFIFHLDESEKERVDIVISQIDNLSSNLTLDDSIYVESCSKAYDELSFKQKIRVDNYNVLKNAINDISDLKVQKAIESINNIGEITLEKKLEINSANNYYESLSKKEQSKVSNYSDLKKALSKYNDLLIDKTIGLIDSIGSVSFEKAESIEEAEKFYKDLNENIKSKITNYDKLLSARKDLDNLLIDYVTKNINKLGSITLNSEASIIDIKEKYALLSEENKEKVHNYSILINAEKKLDELKQKKIEEEKKLSEGETFSTSKWKVTYKRTNLSAKIKPNVTNGYYMYYNCDDDQTFVDMVFEIKNVDTDILGIEDIVESVEVTYNKTYKYESYNLYTSEGTDIDQVYSWDGLNALDSTTLHIAVTIPREAQTNDNPIFVKLNLCGQEKTIEVR